MELKDSIANCADKYGCDEVETCFIGQSLAKRVNKNILLYQSH